MLKKRFISIIAGIFMLTALTAGAFFFWLFSAEPADKFSSDFFLKVLDLKGPNPVQSGDIIVWSTTSIKSLLIEEMTDGLYSHSGIIHEGRDHEFWVMDTFPEKGLRDERITDYLRSSKYPLTRAAILRYQHKLDLKKLEETLQNVLRPDHQIVFDESMVYDNISLKDVYKKGAVTSLYCTELAVKVLEEVSGNSINIDNDYERVMTKWQLVSEGKQVNGLSPITTVKKFYLWAKLEKLKRNPEKKLITPNGLARSRDFKVIRRAEGGIQAGVMKKNIAQMPEIPASQNAPAVQR